MGRYRPPQKPGSPYITPEGERKLQAELQHLWKVERPAVTAAVSAAAANGDRSENGDYIYGKRRLAEIDRRVRYLDKRLAQLKIVHDLPKERNRVFFGAWVTIENEQGEQQRLRIVGPDEFDLEKKCVSMDAPMARAMLGKYLDDDFILHAGDVTHHWVIIDIAYRQGE